MRSLSERRQLVEGEHQELSLVQQCILLSIHRSGLYYEPKGESAYFPHRIRHLAALRQHGPAAETGQAASRNSQAGGCVGFERWAVFLEAAGGWGVWEAGEGVRARRFVVIHGDFRQRLKKPRLVFLF